MMRIPTKEHVEAYNKLCEKVNDILSELKPILSGYNGKKIKLKSGKLSKKFYDSIKDIISKYNNNDKSFECYVKRDFNFLILKCSIYYTVNSISVEYINKTIYLGEIKNYVLNLFEDVINSKLKKVDFINLIQTLDELNLLEREYLNKKEKLEKKIPIEFKI